MQMTIIFHCALVLCTVFKEQIQKEIQLIVFFSFSVKLLCARNDMRAVCIIVISEESILTQDREGEKK